MISKDLDHTTKADLQEYFKDRDYMVIAVPKEEPARVYVLKASDAVKKAQEVHSLNGEEAIALGKVMVGALLLTSLVKHATDQKILLKVQGIIEGYSLIAEADGRGRVRGMIEESLYQEPTLTVVRELGMGTPYTSIVPLQSKDMALNISFYLRQSEQVPSAVSLDVVEDERGNLLAGGFLLQTMGGISSAVLDLLEERVLTCAPMGSMLRQAMRPEDIATKLLEGMHPLLVGLKEVEYFCPCSEDIARASLLTLSYEELQEITREGPAEVRCRFCGKVYHFSGEDIIDRA